MRELLGFFRVTVVYPAIFAIGALFGQQLAMQDALDRGYAQDCPDALRRYWKGECPEVAP